MTARVILVEDAFVGRAWWIELPDGDRLGWWRDPAKAAEHARAMGADQVLLEDDARDGAEP